MLAKEAVKLCVQRDDNIIDRVERISRIYSNHEWSKSTGSRDRKLAEDIFLLMRDVAGLMVRSYAEMERIMTIKNEKILQLINESNEDGDIIRSLRQQLSERNTAT